METLHTLLLSDSTRPVDVDRLMEEIITARPLYTAALQSYRYHPRDYDKLLKDIDEIHDSLDEIRMIKNKRVRKCLQNIMRRYAFPLEPPVYPSGLEPYKDMQAFQKISHVLKEKKIRKQDIGNVLHNKRGFYHYPSLQQFHKTLTQFYQHDLSPDKEPIGSVIPISIGFEFQLGFLSFHSMQWSKNKFINHATKSGYRKPIALSLPHVTITSDQGTSSPPPDCIMPATAEFTMPNGKRHIFLMPKGFMTQQLMYNDCEFIVTYPNPEKVSIRSGLGEFIERKLNQAIYETLETVNKDFVIIPSFPRGCFYSELRYNPRIDCGIFKKTNGGSLITPHCSLGVSCLFLKAVTDEYYRWRHITEETYLFTQYVTNLLPDSVSSMRRDYFFFFLYSYLTREKRKAGNVFVLRIHFKQAWRFWIGEDGRQFFRTLLSTSTQLVSALRSLENFDHERFIIYFNLIHNSSDQFPSQNMQETTFFPMTHEQVIIVEFRDIHKIPAISILNNRLIHI